MNLTDVLFFILKYIPFWAVPLGLIGVHFAYLYWLKDYREAAYVWIGLVLFCLTSVVFYLLMGGPDQINQILLHNIH